MATTVPTMLTSSTQESVLKELDEATSELLHLSLDIHTPQHTSPNRSGVRMGSNRARRRKSVEELRVARNIIDDLTTVSSRADNCEEGRSSRHATARPDAGMRSTTEPPWNISTSNQQLLRRVTSADDLLIAGDEQDDEDDFSSDVRDNLTDTHTIADHSVLGRTVSDATSFHSVFYNIPEIVGE